MIAIDENDKCVGSTMSYKFPLNDSYVFGLMMYNNKEYAQLRFKLYDSYQNKYFNLKETLAFESDMHLGNGFNPVVMRIKEVNNDILINRAYPNPFNPVINFDLNLLESQNIVVKIYNIEGREIETLYNNFMESGFHKMHWDGGNYSSGIYILSLNSKQHHISSKITLIK